MTTTTNVEIKRLNQVEITLRMVGTTPLYFNSMSVKTKRDLLNITPNRSSETAYIKNLMAKLCYVSLLLELSKRWRQRLLRPMVLRKLL
jgi:hypothetical protein